jgi:hypothetical protein
VTRRVGELLQKLPRDINPVNLEELRRIKQALVELENKASAHTPLAPALAVCGCRQIMAAREWHQLALTPHHTSMLQLRIRAHQPGTELNCPWQLNCPWHLQPTATSCHLAAQDLHLQPLSLHLPPLRLLHGLVCMCAVLCRPTCCVRCWSR